MLFDNGVSRSVIEDRAGGVTCRSRFSFFEHAVVGTTLDTIAVLPFPVVTISWDCQPPFTCDCNSQPKQAFCRRLRIVRQVLRALTQLTGASQDWIPGRQYAPSRLPCFIWTKFAMSLDVIGKRYPQVIPSVISGAMERVVFSRSTFRLHLCIESRVQEVSPHFKIPECAFPRAI